MPAENRKKIKPITYVLIILIALIVGFAGFVVYKRYFVKDSQLSSPLDLFKKTDTTLVVNNLDGTKVEKTNATRNPLAIMVENHPEARPQSGLDKASIIYEAITEGGITRFMAIYGPKDADKVGPVRSARTYYIDWLSEFNAFYSHVGGNLDALQKIKTDGILDLDQFGLGTFAYWREPKTGVAIEHTMFTSTKLLYTYAFNNKKWDQTGDFEALKFKDAIELSLRESGQQVTIPFSSASYEVTWKFDKASNTYLRYMGGFSHKDAITGEQLAASNIIIQEVSRAEAPTEIGEQGWKMDTIGKGKIKVFLQGKEINGTWEKDNRTSRTLFFDDTKNEIKFIPGQFWIEIVPPDVFPNIKVESLTSTTTTE